MRLPARLWLRFQWTAPTEIAWEQLAETYFRWLQLRRPAFFPELSERVGRVEVPYNFSDFWQFSEGLDARLEEVVRMVAGLWIFGRFRYVTLQPNEAARTLLGL